MLHRLQEMISNVFGQNWVFSFFLRNENWKTERQERQSLFRLLHLETFEYILVRYFLALMYGFISKTYTLKAAVCCALFEEDSEQTKWPSCNNTEVKEHLITSLLFTASSTCMRHTTCNRLKSYKIM